MKFLDNCYDIKLKNYNITSFSRKRYQNDRLNQFLDKIDKNTLGARESSSVEVRILFYKKKNEKVLQRIFILVITLLNLIHFHGGKKRERLKGRWDSFLQLVGIRE